MPSWTTVILCPHRTHSNSAIVTFGRTSVAFLTRPSMATNVPRCLALSFLMSTLESCGSDLILKCMNGLVSVCETSFLIASSADLMDSVGFISV